MDQFVRRLHSEKMLVYFYWTIKILLGLGFVLSGLRKLPGVKFTQLPITNPVGLFFEGMYVTGFYWNFIGYYQILVGLILMTRWWQALSPLLILPVTVNIFLVSVSLEMRGTPVITGLMLLGNLFLMVWHWEKYKPILKRKG